MIVDFERERRWWDAKAPGEEREVADEFFNRALRWRELERRLAGVTTILEIGGATGAFSIPLAERGFAVTHLDFSPAMLARARAQGGHLPSLRFVEANAVALPFADRSFDLVLNMDGAVSFCGSAAVSAIHEACRVTRRTLVLTVSNRANLSALMVSGSLRLSGGLLPAVQAMLERGEWHQEEFADNALFAAGCTQDYVGALKAFLPGELEAILAEAGMTPLRVGGLGSLTQACKREDLERLREDAEALSGFLDVCERFDAEIAPGGPGTWQRAGLIAVAERPGQSPAPEGHRCSTTRG